MHGGGEGGEGVGVQEGEREGVGVGRKGEKPGCWLGGKNTPTGWLPCH